jgi:hypothetical protein
MSAVTSNDVLSPSLLFVDACSEYAVSAVWILLLSLAAELCSLPGPMETLSIGEGGMAMRLKVGIIGWFVGLIGA